MASPKPTYLKAAKNLLRYLSYSKDLAICYGREAIPTISTTIRPKPPNLSRPFGYYNSDFAGDIETSKSTYGYLFILALGPITWKSKRASTIYLSTLEAETDAITEAIREVQWLKSLFSKLGRPISGPLAIYNDN